MRKMLTNLVLAVTLLAGAPLLQAQSSNQIWFAVWNGQPTPSSDVAVRALATDGTASTLATGTATNFISQTNFSAFHSPYDVAVDPAMGKVYVLDNNAQGVSPEYIYSFDLSGTPSQIAASGQVIYTLPVPSADVYAGVYPLISGLALDPANHWLYFNQFDSTTGTNSYIGRLDLASSARSDVHSTAGGNPAMQEFYPGQIPGLGPIALDTTNLYLGAINGHVGNSGVYVTPRNGHGVFSELVSVSTNDTAFTNGFTGGVASDPADHLVYYLTWNAGELTGNDNTNQNALWVYDTISHTRTKISGGYAGYPDNLAVDAANGRYYFTVSQDGSGQPLPANHQAIYTGRLGTTNTPTLLYTPGLSGQDAAGQINAGQVALQGLYVEDAPALSLHPGQMVYAVGQPAMVLAPALVPDDPSSTALMGASVAIVGGTFAGDGDTLTADTNGTSITASYNAATETLTLSGSDTLTHYQQVLRSVAFGSSNGDPTQGGAFPTRTLAWTISDGVLASPVVKSTLLMMPMPTADQVTIHAEGNDWLMLFSGSAGQSYVVQTATTVAGPWTDLSPVLTAGANGLVAYFDGISPASQARFYRVRTAP